jgi:hypothetical protein
MKRLIAKFDMPYAQLRAIAARDAERSGEPADALTLTPDLDVCSQASGEAQAVMFLIGAVAAEGEATLRTVEAA